MLTPARDFSQNSRYADQLNENSAYKPAENFNERNHRSQLILEKINRNVGKKYEPNDFAQTHHRFQSQNLAGINNSFESQMPSPNNHYGLARVKERATHSPFNS